MEDNTIDRPIVNESTTAQLRNATQKVFEKQRSLQDLYGRNNASDELIEKKSPVFQRNRSNSDGAAILLSDHAEVFPSLPNTILEKLGLYGESSRDRISDESLEQKFTTLSLAFSIDATTINNRLERQKRARDQTDSNFNLEVEKLRGKLALLQPLCTDLETAELLSGLFAEVDTVTQAASLVSIAAERYGAVQHEARLTECVQLMVSYVQMLKQQRDTVRRQLQYTKRVLQEPVQTSTSKSSINKKTVGKRRASTDSVQLNSSHHFDQSVKFNRRTSDSSFRASLAKSRPSRLDLGLELNNIKEVSTDDGVKEDQAKHSSLDAGKEDDCLELDEIKFIDSDPPAENRLFGNIIRLRFASGLESVRDRISTKWTEKGCANVLLHSCAVLCFSVSILTLVGIFFEQSSGKYWSFK